MPAGSKAAKRLTHESALGDIEANADRLCRSLRHANSLPQLIATALDEDAHLTVATAAAGAVARVLSHHGVPHLSRRAAQAQTKTQLQDDAMAKLRAFLVEQQASFVDALLARLRTADGERSIVAMHVLMELIAATTSGDGSASSPLSFADAFLARLLNAMLDPATDKEKVLDAFSETYLPYADVRLFTLRTLARAATNVESDREAQLKDCRRRSSAKRAKLSEKQQAADTDEEPEAVLSRERAFVTNAYMILHQLEMPTEEDAMGELWMQQRSEGASDGLGFESEPLADTDKDETIDARDESPEPEEAAGLPSASALLAGVSLAQPDVVRLAAHQRGFSHCWLAFLRLNLPLDVFKDVLLKLDARVLPHMANPKLLLDFLTDAYNAGGVVAILALNALFVLVHKYHL
jgi:U3 small nucleolar RNA-associated protein 19